MSPPRVLIVDDEAAVRLAVRDFLEASGFAVEEAATCAEAEKIFPSNRPDAAVIDFRLPDGTALDLLPRLKSADPTVPILILTGHGSIDLAVRAIKEGAEQFLTKPVEMATLRVLLERAIENQRARRREAARKVRGDRDAPDPFAGESRAIRELEEQSRRALATESPILIQGETGSGKGVLARWLHANGRRGEEAFVDLNCAGLSREFLESELFGHERGAFTGAIHAKPGLFEVAHRGTLFLDEIGDVDLQVQPKLLKVLEEKQYRRLGDVRPRRADVALIAATHHDLAARIRENSFRSDLYFRISTIPLRVPPLRERSGDVLVLAREFLRRICADLGRPEISLSGPAEESLTRYPWPGNIRELRNVLERAVLLTGGPALAPADLRFDMAPAPGAPAAGEPLTLRELEQRHIERVLHDQRGHVESAARLLGIPRSSLYEKIRRYGITPSKV
jgi:DNA-binding NtrC family response regulator